MGMSTPTPRVGQVKELKAADGRRLEEEYRRLVEVRATREGRRGSLTLCAPCRDLALRLLPPLGRHLWPP